MPAKHIILGLLLSLVPLSFAQDLDKDFVTMQEAVDLGYFRVNTAKDQPVNIPIFDFVNFNLSGNVSGVATQGLLPSHESPWATLPFDTLLVQLKEISGYPIYVRTDATGDWYANVQNSTGSVIVDQVSDYLAVRSMTNDTNGEPIVIYVHKPDGTFQVMSVYYFPLRATWNIPNNPIDLSWQDVTDFHLAVDNVFVHCIATELWIKSILPNWEGFYSFALANGPSLCNAFYTGDTHMLLFCSRGSCANTAYSTVIRHEFGHGFLCSFHAGSNGDCTTSRYPDFIDYPAYHEAVADLISAFSLGTSCLGEDMLHNGSGCFRNLENNMIWPVNNPDSHIRGMALSGAYWDMRTNILNDGDPAVVADTLLLRSIIINYTGYTPLISNDVIQVDEELYGGRHKNAIVRAFGRHGLSTIPWLQPREATHTSNNAEAR